MVRALLAAVLAALLAAPAAHAATRTQILQDCEDGTLSGTYTVSELRDARNNIPADVDQYSDCRDVLTRALTSGAGGGGGGGGGTSGGGGATGGTGGTGGTDGASAAPLTPSGPEEQEALSDAARSAGDAPVRLGERAVVPGAGGFDAGAARNPLPTTVIVTLVLLAVAAAAATAPALRRRVHRHRAA